MMAVAATCFFIALVTFTTLPNIALVSAFVMTGAVIEAVR